jgi:dipeptidyl aminopeptidase/acylaminoacyl peptidase
MRSSFPNLRDARVFAFGVALSFVVAIALRYAGRGYTFTHPPRVVVTAEESARAHAALPGLEDVTLHTEDGLDLRGWFSPGNRGAAVIFVSGNGSNRAQLESEALILGRHGYGVLTFDSRGAGTSDGNLSTWGDRERLDARAAVDYVLTRREIDPRRIALLGHSVGASTVVMEASSDPRVGAVIVYACWTSMENEL